MSEWSPTPLPHNGSSVSAGFHVRYEVRDSTYGKGLFALHDIPNGTLLWKYAPGAKGAKDVNVISFKTEDEARARLHELPSQEARAFWMDHVYMFDGKLNEILDDGYYWNHSETPCTGLPPEGEQYCFESSYAVRDIKAGEELLDDYGLYEYPEWYNRLCAEFGVKRDFVCVKSAPVRHH
jgi:SET domain-containing protein